MDSPNRYLIRLAIDGRAILISNGPTAHVPDHRKDRSYDLEAGFFILLKSIEDTPRLSVEKRKKAQASSVSLLEEGDSFSCTSYNNEYRRTPQRQNRKDPQVACLQSSRANFLIRLIVIIRDPQNQNSSPDSPILPKDPQRSLSNFFPLEKCVPRVNASRAPTANHKPRTSKKSSLGVCIYRIRTCVRFTASNLDRREEAQEWNERTRNGRAAVIFPKLS